MDCKLHPNLGDAEESGNKMTQVHEVLSPGLYRQTPGRDQAQLLPGGARSWTPGWRPCTEEEKTGLRELQGRALWLRQFKMPTAHLIVSLVYSLTTSVNTDTIKK